MSNNQESIKLFRTDTCVYIGPEYTDPTTCFINVGADKVKEVTFKPLNFFSSCIPEYRGTIRAINEINSLAKSGEEVIFYFSKEDNEHINVYASGKILTVTYGTNFHFGDFTYVESITFDDGKNIKFGIHQYNLGTMKYGIVLNQ